LPRKKKALPELKPHNQKKKKKKKNLSEVINWLLV
jgi:hypothetical protein